MMKNTELDNRLDILHVLLGMLIAHLGDAGVIQVQILQSDMRDVMDSSDAYGRAYADVDRIFDTVYTMMNEWENQRN